MDVHAIQPGTFQEFPMMRCVVDREFAGITLNTFTGLASVRENIRR